MLGLTIDPRMLINEFILLHLACLPMLDLAGGAREQLREVGL